MMKSPSDRLAPPDRPLVAADFAEFEKRILALEAATKRIERILKRSVPDPELAD